VTVRTIYAQARREGVSRETFVHRWRRHGALAMSLPSFWDPVARYMQSDLLQNLSGFPHASPAYVAVGEIHYRDIGARTQSKQSPELATVLHPDASEFFRREVQIHAGVEDVHLFHGRYAPVKIYVFVSQAPGGSKPSFFAEWEGLQARVLAESPSGHLLRRLVCGRALEGSVGMDGTAELSFDSVNDAATFYREWLARMEAATLSAVRRDSMVIVPAFVSLFYDRKFYEG
jgi:hypothetical protein